MNRRTTLSLVLRMLLVAVVGLSLAGFTMAMWSDSATSTGNVFATGNLDLKLREGNSWTWVQGPVSATWHAENMYPGQELDVGGLYFQNAGSIEGQTFDIAVTNACSVPGMDRYIEIVTMDYENGSRHNLLTDPLFGVGDLNGNGWIDLDDLEADSCICLPAPDTAGALTMDYRFRPEAGNEFQASSATANFTFTLHQ